MQLFVLFFRRAAQTTLMTGILAYCTLVLLGIAAAVYGNIKNPFVGTEGYFDYAFSFTYREALAGLIVLDPRRALGQTPLSLEVVVGETRMLSPPRASSKSWGGAGLQACVVRTSSL